MSSRRGGWYGYLERKLAPTKKAANVVLVVLMGITAWVLVQPSATIKAGWIAYWVSP